MFKNYRYQLNPTEEQKIQLNQIFGGCRFLYNSALELKIESYKRGKKLTCFDIQAQLPEIKKEFVWLSQLPSQALQMQLGNLDNAFTRFFKKQSRFPKFKSKKDKQSFQVPQNIRFNFEDYKIRIPKIKWIKFYKDRKFNGEIKNTTIFKTKTNKYFISVCINVPQVEPVKNEIKKETAIGLDLGLKHFVTLSNNTKIENPKFLRNSLKRLRIEKRKLSRRFKKGKEQSNSYKKQKLIVAKLYEKITNQRNDFLHKLSTSITKNYDSICVENLGVSNMIQNKNLALSISDVGWGEFTRQLEYKCNWYGKNFLQIGRFEPSSKMCSNCGNTKQKLELSERIYTCNKCNLKIDRDFNASINIRDFGLRSKPLYANVEFSTSCVV